jgi:hypothetical protein
LLKTAGKQTTTRILEFHACEEGLQIIQDEHAKYAGSSISLSESEAIRSLTLRAATPEVATTGDAGEEDGDASPNNVLQGRRDKVFIR